MKKILLVLSAMLLASCGGGNATSSSAESSKSVQESSEILTSVVTSVEVSSSEASVSSEEATTVEAASSEEETIEIVSSEEEPQLESSEEEVSSEEVSSEEETFMEIAEVGAWTIDYTCIDATEQNQYLFDYSFNVTSKNNETLPFHGDYIQRGSGDWEGLVQMRKNEGEGFKGYIDSKFPMSGTITLSVKIRSKFYNNEDHDFTGIPTFACGTLTEQSEVEPTSVNDVDGFRVYVFPVDGYFTLTSGAANAVMFSTMSFE